MMADPQKPPSDLNGKPTGRFSLIVWMSLLAVAVCVFVAGGFLAYRLEAQIIRKEEVETLESIVQIKVNQLLAWRNERLANARMNSTGLIRTYALQWLMSPDNAAFKERLMGRMQEFRAGMSYQNLMIISAEGELLLSLDADAHELDDQTKQWVRRAVQSRTPIMGDLSRCAICGHIHLDILSPILVGEESPPAVLLMRTDPNDYLYPLIQSWPTVSKSAETVLVSRDGDQAVFLNPLRHRPDPPLSVRFPLSCTNVPAVQAVMGGTGVTEGQDYRGVDVMTVIQPVAGSSWYLIAKVDKAELIGDIRDRGRAILIIGILGLVSLLVVAAAMYGNRRTMAYRQLYASEARYHQVLDSMLEGCQIIGQDWRYLYLNQTAIQHARRPKEELLGKRFMDAWPGVEKTPLFEALEQVMNSGSPRNFDNEFLYPDGSKGLFQLSIQRVREGIFILSMDITERKRVETALEAGAAETRRLLEESTRSRRALLSVVEDLRLAQQLLKDSEEQYHKLFDEAEDGIALAEADTGIIADCNQALCRTVERSRNEIVGQHQSILHPRQSAEAEFTPTFRRHRAEAAGQILEAELLSKTGAHIPVEIRGTPLSLRGKAYVMGVFRDISVRKRAEQALRESEVKYRALVEQAPAITYTAALDEASTTLYISPQIEAILGYTPAEYAADPDTWCKIVHPEDVDRVLADVDNTQKTGQPYSAEYRMIAKDGRVVWVCDQGAIVRDEHGHPLFLQGVMYDVTQLKQAEEEIRKLNEQLEQRVRDRTAQLEAANKELEAFSYSVSHDLRAPLRSIDGFSQAILEASGGHFSAETKANFERVRTAAQQMSRLIDGMLGLARLTRREMHRRDVNLSAIADELLQGLHRTEPSRRVAVEVARDVVVNGDPDLLKIVIQNLVENAWKFTRNTADARIEFGVIRHSNTPVFFVRDNGAGFDLAYAGKLFGAFQRLHTEAEFSGTGVGLASVQRILLRHGGRIWAEGAVGQGATFFFTL